MTRILVSLAVLLWPVTLVAQDPAAGLTGQPPIQQMTPAGGPSVAVDVAAQDAVHQGALQGPAGLWSGILAYYADLRNAVLYAINEGAQDHMSPVGMFMAADWVVKAVMLSLAFASVLTWAIFVGKMVSLALRRRAIARQYRDLERAGTLRAMPLRMKSGKGVVGRMAHAALAEWEGTGHRQELHAGIKERTGSVLGRIEVGAARRLGVGTGILANIGATAPFVGLFGTVWGIMNSFISIAQSNTTNLAVVAPGIAEALLATAIGLVAAIPAVIFYNLITRGLGGYRVMLGDAAALVERTLSRDLDLLPGTSGGTPEMPVKPVRPEPIRNMKAELPANETGPMAAAE